MGTTSEGQRCVNSFQSHFLTFSTENVVGLVLALQDVSVLQDAKETEIVTMVVEGIEEATAATVTDAQDLHAIIDGNPATET